MFVYVRVHVRACMCECVCGCVGVRVFQRICQQLTPTHFAYDVQNIQVFIG